MIFPGTPTHQKVLKTIVEHYQHDSRLRAVTIFGSLARGNWDCYSDLDLDVIVQDDAVCNPVLEARDLNEAFQAVGEKLAFVIPDGDDAVDLVLGSLLEISIRYHPLATTKYVIVENLLYLTGNLDIETIKQAGLANPPAKSSSPEIALDRCVRYAIEIKVAIERQRFWMAVELLHRTRNLLMEIFALTSDGERFIQHFDKTASQEISDLLASILPTATTLPQAYKNLLRILINDIPRLSNDQLLLTPHHQAILLQL